MRSHRSRRLWRSLYTELMWRLKRCERVLVRIERRLVSCEVALRRMARDDGTTIHTVELLGTLAFAAFVMAAVALFVALFG